MHIPRLILLVPALHTRAEVLDVVVGLASAETPNSNTRKREVEDRYMLKRNTTQSLLVDTAEPWRMAGATGLYFPWYTTPDQSLPGRART